eukprot:Selendium_serpulae@DN1165_c0_g1_i1.p1
MTLPFVAVRGSDSQSERGAGGAFELEPFVCPVRHHPAYLPHRMLSRSSFSVTHLSRRLSPVTQVCHSGTLQWVHFSGGRARLFRSVIPGHPGSPRVGIPQFSSFGIPQFSSFGIPQFSSFGIPQFSSFGIPQFSSFGIPQFSS